MTTAIECSLQDLYQIKHWLQRRKYLDKKKFAITKVSDTKALVPLVENLPLPIEDLIAQMENELEFSPGCLTVDRPQSLHRIPAIKSTRQLCVETLECVSMELALDIKHLRTHFPSRWEQYDGFVLFAGDQWEAFSSQAVECLQDQRRANVFFTTLSRIFAKSDHGVVTVSTLHPMPSSTSPPVSFAQKTPIPKGDVLRKPRLQWLWRGDLPTSTLTNQNQPYPPLWTSAIQNGIRYHWSPDHTMFSMGNITEKARVARFQCKGEIVLDMYAGIGYFTLPLLIHSGAEKLIACEWNPWSVDGLVRSLEYHQLDYRRTNEVAIGDISSPRVWVLEGDNQRFSDFVHHVVDRVHLGLLPDARAGFRMAARALKPTGGFLHVHENVMVGEEEQWLAEVLWELTGFLQEDHGFPWDLSVRHVEQVKSFAPRVYHYVADVECRPRPV